MSSYDPYTPPAAPSVLPVQEPALTFGRTLFSFRGRIPRRIYWLWTVVAIAVFGGGLGVAEGILGETANGNLLTILTIVLYSPMLWILLALKVKRWHDRDKSGVWVLINFVPLIGGIWSFVETGCLRGTEGPNQYGEDPT